MCDSVSSVTVVWLGQGGFLFVLPSGRRIVVDAYLSDSLYEDTKSTAGFTYKRLAAVPIAPEDVCANEIFCSHEHEDHLDSGSILTLTKNPDTRLFTNPISVERAKKIGVNPEQIHTICRYDFLDFGEYTVKVLPAQHGQMAPEAMGFLFDFGGFHVYYAGDTSLDKDLLVAMQDAKPDLALLPINGAYGNLNAQEAAEYAAFCGAKRCIPYHFWTFAGHGGDPMAFCEALPAQAPDCELIMLTPGEELAL